MRSDCALTLLAAIAGLYLPVISNSMTAQRRCHEAFILGRDKAGNTDRAITRRGKAH